MGREWWRVDHADTMMLEVEADLKLTSDKYETYGLFETHLRVDQGVPDLSLSLRLGFSRTMPARRCERIVLPNFTRRPQEYSDGGHAFAEVQEIPCRSDRRPGPAS